eukprot:6491516-Amphidinium_carterae.1
MDDPLTNFDQLQVPRVPCDPRDDLPKVIFSEHEIASALRRASPHKASPDLQASDGSRQHPQIYAINAHPRDGCRTRGLARLLFLSGKRKQSAQVASSYRPVCLLLQSHKLATRVLLDRLTLTINVDHSQMANRKRIGTDFVQLCVTQFRAWAYRENLSLCLLFVDLTDAFTTVWCDKLFGQPPRDPHADTDDHAPDTPSVVEWFAAYHSSILGIAGAPLEIVDLLRTSHSATWLKVLTGYGCSKHLTTLGLKQGCVLASWLFGVFLDAAKRSIKADLELEGLLQTVPAVSLESFPHQDAHTELAITSLDWVDDMVSPRWAADPVQAVRESKVAFGIVLNGLRRFHLRPNLQKGKTEVMTTLRGPSARGAKLGLKRDGALLVTSGDKISVTSSYKHLGRLISDQVSDISTRRRFTPSCPQAKQVATQ